MALENYTTYSEYDASGLVTVGANTLAVAGNNNTAFSVHKVFAAGHFSGDFEHVVATKINNDGENNNSYGVFWGLSNKTSDVAHSPKQIDEANEDVLYAVAQEYTNDKVAIMLREVVAGTQYQSFELNLSFDTWYYCEIERDEDTGTYGTLLCRIYSDESRTTLLKTLSVTLHEKEDFRTVYAVSSFYNNSGRAYSQDIKNLDLQEAATITATGAATFPAAIASGECVTSHKEASGAPEFPAATADGAAVMTRYATGTPEFPAATSDGAAKRTVPATGAPAFPLLEADGTQVAIFTGTGAPEFPALTSDGAAVMTRYATGDVTFAAATAAGAGARTVYAEGIVTLAALEAAGAGVATRIATAAAAFPAFTGEGAATVGRFAIGAIEFPALTADGEAALAGPATADGAATFPALTSDGTATVGRVATGDITFPALTAAGSDSDTDTWTGTSTSTFPAFTASGRAKMKPRAGIALEHVRFHLGLSTASTADTDHLLLLLDAAVNFAEHYCGVRIGQREYDEYVTAMDSTAPLRVSVLPLVSVSAISDAYDDSTVDSDGYRINEDRTGITPVESATWDTGAERYRIVYTAGYGGAIQVPHAIRGAILLMVGRWWEMRATEKFVSSEGKISKSFWDFYGSDIIRLLDNCRMGALVYA